MNSMPFRQLKSFLKILIGVQYEVFKFLGIGDIAYNQPKSLPYPTENPFA